MEGDRAMSPGSTIANSEMDEQMTTHPSSPSRIDPRSTLKHVLDNPDSRTNTPPIQVPRATQDMTEDDEIRTPGGPAEATSKSTSRKRKDPPLGGLGSIQSGNKIKHLKKEDGEPLWRKDIQYDFLKYVFDDPQEVFTNSYDPSRPKQNFADMYIDTMARSSKTSKILRDKLLTEHEPAKNMAMVCLLVNLGRMNTTLNFFPEMRAQLRTYHAIPSLQAQQDPNSYKQLQDAPRLKSILKGASEDRVEPNSLEKIKMQEVPRTNPVNLIFVLAQYAPKVTELHFPPGNDFNDMLMADHLSSFTRARAFLWLMWFYLESDFTEEGADENPFGPGVDYDVDVRNQGVPRFDQLSIEDQAKENVDTEEECEYGRAKMRERKRIIEADQAVFQAEHGPPKRGPKPKLNLAPDEGPAFGRIRSKYDEASPAALRAYKRPKYESDMDSTRSTPPPRALTGMRIQSVLNTGKNRGTGLQQMMDGSSPVPYVEEPTIIRRPRLRPLTAHQLAVERNRNQRVNYLLSRGLNKSYHVAKKQRKQEGAIWRATQRLNRFQNDVFEDSEDEESLAEEALGSGFKERGMAGLVPLYWEVDDFGEEMAAYCNGFRRSLRRLARWEGQVGLGVMGTGRIPSRDSGDANGNDTGRDNDETEDDQPASQQMQMQMQPRANGHDLHHNHDHDHLHHHDEDQDQDHSRMEEEEDLDDMEKEILGMGSDAEDVDVDGDEDLDEVDKALLNLGGGDDTEDDASDGMDVD
ncbi:related to Dictyostelium protein kinase [Rhynchosporium secalis]|uniref:Related to Dictyostelium protein kinase n=1 Tax=Rhynchosporium secalis TaxID=38038 RepID=A0A1E1MEG2_RHYSE|nr:related to Dictyostelium protein kinase [Rhynchosporium secalis]